MGAKAVGAYLHALREAAGLTALDVIAAIVHEAPDLTPPPTKSHISKIEHGTIGSPGLRIVALINRALGGNPAHVNWLMLDRNATAVQGRELAAQWLALSPEEREQLAVLHAPFPFFRELAGKLRELLEEDRLEQSDELPPELLKYVQTPEGRAALQRALREAKEPEDQ